MSMEETETTSYIIPDVLVKRENGAWQITINDRWMGDYGIDGYYLRMMKETKDAQLKEYFREKLQRAHFLIDAVERRRTIAKYRILMGIPDSRQRALL